VLVLGLGNDIVDIRRIEAILERWGERFINRVFTPIEIEKAEKRAGRAATYAKRFAAKEACCKALGTGIRMGVNWRAMGVVNLSTGQPTLELKDGALERLQSFTPSGMAAQVSLTLTDDYPYAQAVVLITACPPHLLAGTARLDKHAAAGPHDPEGSRPI